MLRGDAAAFSKSSAATAMVKAVFILAVDQRY
jgi:hypothetical protein